MKFLLRAIVGLIAIYLVAAGGLFAIMWLPPGQFAAVAAHIPGPVMMIGFPFRAAWTIARGGSLSPGDPAPGFDLARHDKTGRVTLSQFSGRPVVLIFGSYT
ncbi:MAG: hypothetical protein U0R19_13475 [Bryobacteraceae bacterium]